MPLPAPSERSEIHHRRIDMKVFRRQDGLYDVEGHLTDVKQATIDIPWGRTTAAGTPVHEMWLRLTVDRALLIHGAVAASDAAPYGDCFGAPPTLSKLVGLRIAGGWVRAVKERLGGPQSCTHLVEMLTPMGTAAMQALWSEPGGEVEAKDADGRPLLLNSCWALSSERAVAFRRWPEHYTGTKSSASDRQADPPPER